jgi:hypothetical protein
VPGAGQDQTFDLVWAGGALVASDETAARTLLDNLSGYVKANGILVIASHGRFSALRAREWDRSRNDRPWVHYGLGQNIDKVLDGYFTFGFGYTDYPGQKGQGICIADADWYARHLLSDGSFTRVLLQEKGWDNHLDVQAFVRTPILMEGRGPLLATGFRAITQVARTDKGIAADEIDRPAGISTPVQIAQSDLAGGDCNPVLIGESRGHKMDKRRWA